MDKFNSFLGYMFLTALSWTSQVWTLYWLCLWFTTPVFGIILQPLQIAGLGLVVSIFLMKKEDLDNEESPDLDVVAERLLKSWIVYIVVLTLGYGIKSFL